MDRTCLPIQGPPGTGKTYVASQAILALLRDGKRVAVTSNSHKAIGNLMAAIAARAREQKFTLQAIQKVSNGEPPPDPAIELTSKNEDARLATYPLVAGTVWLLARPEHDQQFEYLFVDEAAGLRLPTSLPAQPLPAISCSSAIPCSLLSRSRESIRVNHVRPVSPTSSTATRPSHPSAASFSRFRAACIRLSAPTVPISFTTAG